MQFSSFLGYEVNRVFLPSEHSFLLRKRKKKYALGRVFVDHVCQFYD